MDAVEVTLYVVQLFSDFPSQALDILLQVFINVRPLPRRMEASSGDAAMIVRPLHVFYDNLVTKNCTVIVCPDVKIDA